MTEDPLDVRKPMHSQLVYDYADTVYSWVLEIGGISETFGNIIEDLDLNKISRPHKDTLLNDVIRHAGYVRHEYAVWDAASYHVDHFRIMLLAAGMRIPRWLTEKVLERAEPDHRGRLAVLVERAFEAAVAPAVFHILFSDRTFLIHFQERVTERVSALNRTEHRRILVRDGVLKRCKPPVWLQKAVFYRDRGVCQTCQRNVSGLDSPHAERHLDHIVPLAMSGSNDPTNFQLLCGRCNVSKGARRADRIAMFTPYW